METPGLPVPPPPENGHSPNPSLENRVPRPPNHRPAPPLPEILRMIPAASAVNCSPEHRIQKVPENWTPKLGLPENRSPEKPMPSYEDRATDRDDLALSPSPVVGVNLSYRDEVGSVTKMEGVGMDRSSRVVPSILRRSRQDAILPKAELVFRVLGLIFCLISFSVMASDKTQGWSGDSFDRYKEYRYCIAVTVIGFVYAGFQACAQGHYLITGKRLIQNPIHRYFDFSLDQILAYLLMSASSSAATRTDSWVTTWGEDDFTKMASASIGMSFLAFAAFAFSALISGYYICRRKI